MGAIATPEQIALAHRAEFEEWYTADCHAREWEQRRNSYIDRGYDQLVMLHGGYPQMLNVRRLWNIDNLPTVRTLMTGRRWMRTFWVEQRSLDEVRPPWKDKVSYRRRWVLTFTLEDDVRELVTRAGFGARDALRPDVIAEW